MDTGDSTNSVTEENGPTPQPQEPAEPAPVPQVPSPHPREGSKKTIRERLLNSGAASPVTVHVVDDDPAVRGTLQLLLESAGLNAECFASAEEFLKAFESSKPDCVVVDMGLPGRSGIELAEDLHYRGVTTPVIFFTGNEDAKSADRAMKTGARDFCAKSRGPEALLACVRQAIRSGGRDQHEFELSHETTGRIIELTPREREVLELLILGYTNRQVGVLLGISSKTVATHRASLMRKTECDSIAALARRWRAFKAGAAPKTN